MARRMYTKLEQQIASEAKRANTRLRQLERSQATASPAYKYVQLLKYEDRNLKPNERYTGTTKGGQVKFRTDIQKLSISQQKEYLKAIQAYTNSATSTVRGFKESQQPLKKMVGQVSGATALSDEDYNRIWASSISEFLKQILPSDDVAERVEMIKTNQLTLEQAEEALLTKFNVPLVEFEASLEDISGQGQKYGGNVFR